MEREMRTTGVGGNQHSPVGRETRTTGEGNGQRDTTSPNARRE